MLTGAKVLVVEDETLVALFVAEILEEAGAIVVGPVRSNRDAVALLAKGRPDIAVLDVNVADGVVTPTAEQCLEAGVPVLFCTGGLNPPGLSALPTHRKPITPERLVLQAADLIGRTVSA
jgi:CheY-like chemotaxis protein